jgi:hypothetical protein
LCFIQSFEYPGHFFSIRPPAIVGLSAYQSS